MEIWTLAENAIGDADAARNAVEETIERLRKQKPFHTSLIPLNVAAKTARDEIETFWGVAHDVYNSTKEAVSMTDININLEQIGYEEGVDNMESSSVALFLVTEEPTSMQVEWANGYISGYLAFIEAIFGEDPRYEVENKWEGHTGAKWSQHDIIKDIRMLRRGRFLFKR